MTSNESEAENAQIRDSRRLWRDFGENAKRPGMITKNIHKKGKTLPESCFIFGQYKIWTVQLTLWTRKSA